MNKEILFSGFLGGLVLILWLFVTTTVVPISGDIADRIEGDKEIHSLLKDKIPETGIYWLPSDRSQFSDYRNEPLFVVYYPGTTPSKWITPMIVVALLALVSPMIVGWLLSKASVRILSRYSSRVLFVTVIGLLFAAYGDVYSVKPLDKMLLSSISNVIVWTLVGLILAWRIRPKSRVMESVA